MKLRLTRVVLFFIALIIAVGFSILLRYLLHGLESQTYQATEEVMVDTAHLLSELAGDDLQNTGFDEVRLAEMFDGVRQRKVEAQIYDYLKKDVGIGVYITDEKGIILFDSGNPLKVGKDFSRYNDVRRTLAGEYGARSSREDENDPTSSMLYVAAPIGDRDSPIGVLTVFKKQSDGLVFIQKRRKWILLSTVLIGVGLALLMGAVFVWLFRPIGQLTDYVRAVERGERPSVPELGLGREVNTLSRSLFAMREALEGRKYAENYVQTLTHELKSPLAAIKGSAELLGEEMPLDQRKRFIENIRKEVDRSQSLIKGLLQLSELEGRSELESREQVNLGNLIDEIADSFDASLAVKSLDLKKKIAHLVHVEGDRLLLGALISNLLENAVSFSPEGSVVEVVLEEKEEGVELRVLDSGPGVPDFAKERIFERFYSHRSDGVEQKSTGLGLALVKEAMTLHGGSVVMENKRDGGACVTVAFPSAS